MSRRSAWVLTTVCVAATAWVTWMEWHKPTLRNPEDHIIATGFYALCLMISLAYVWVAADEREVPK